MKKFRFPLRSVQTVRSIRELQAREDFSLCVARHAEALRALQDARDSLASLESLIREQRKGQFRPSEHVAFANEIRLREAKVKQTLEEEAAATRRMDESREKWIVCRRDLRIVDKLEAKAREVYRADVEHEEQAMLDDRSNAIIARLPLIAS